MPQTRTQTCTDQHAEHIIIAFGESSKRMHKAAAAADVRVGQGSFCLLASRLFFKVGPRTKRPGAELSFVCGTPPPRSGGLRCGLFSPDDG